MDTKGIDQMLGILKATAAQASGRLPEAQAASPEGKVDFAQVLKNSIEGVVEKQQTAETKAANFAAGSKEENLHDVMISLQKASISFQEMVQVRNKLVTAYNDIMNMPV